MAKVSKNPLSPEMREEMVNAFVRTLTKINDDMLLRRFLDDLLSPTEKVMLSKRLMAAILLQRGYSYGAVCSALKMSKTTIFLIQRDLLKSGEGYRRVFERFFRESRGQRLLNAIDKFLVRVTLPVEEPPSGLRRRKRVLRRL